MAFVQVSTEALERLENPVSTICELRALLGSCGQLFDPLSLPSYHLQLV